ncbi:MAG: CPBP family glutamic-type intramembrane protease [Coriobacteriia bacterium]|nr:CPBP family glutamic-type intramembrane protease [Coriobacteriia bacterium]
MSKQIASERKELIPIPKMIAEASEQSKALPLVVEILVFFLIMIIIIFVENVLSVFAFLPQLDSLLAGDDVELPIVFFVFITAVMIIIPIIYCRAIERRKLPTMGFRRRGLAAEYLNGLMIGSVMLAASLAICYFTGSMMFTSINPTIPWLMLGIYLVYYLIQGMSEEVLCRGYFLVSLARKQRIIVAIAINSIAFSALHFLNPHTSLLAFINLFLFGVFASVYFVKRGDIWGVAAIHSSWNFVQGNIFGIAVSGTTNTTTVFMFEPTTQGALYNGGPFGLEGGLAVTIVLLVATVIMLLTSSRNVYTAPPAVQYVPVQYVPVANAQNVPFYGETNAPPTPGSQVQVEYPAQVIPPDETSSGQQTNPPAGNPADSPPSSTESKPPDN